LKKKLFPKEVVEAQWIHPTSIFIDADYEVLLSEHHNNFYYVIVNDIIEKCVHWREKSNKVFFFVVQTLKNALNM
jgi:hypothetical protein